jgi:hypothetical protein
MYQTPDMANQGQLLNEVAALIESGKLRTTLKETLSPINAENLRVAHAARVSFEPVVSRLSRYFAEQSWKAEDGGLVCDHFMPERVARLSGREMASDTRTHAHLLEAHLNRTKLRTFCFSSRPLKYRQTS